MAPQGETAADAEGEVAGRGMHQTLCWHHPSPGFALATKAELSI